MQYQRDFYFATKPDIFIRTHFPEESKWQLLSNNITQEQFDSILLLTNYFYSYGFTIIYPNSQIINGKKEATFTLYYDKNGSIPENIVCCALYSNGEKETLILDNLDYKNEDGTIKITVDLSDKRISYLVIGPFYEDRGTIDIISAFKINHFP